MLAIKNINHDKTKGTSRLEFEISGDDIDYIITNTLKRTIQTDVPIYAFTEIIFNKNTSVFHNNFLKNQIKNIPVWGIKNKIDYYVKNTKTVKIEEENDEMDDNIDSSFEKVIDPTSLEQLTMYVNYENKSKDIVCVTTDHAKFYFSQKEIPNPYPIGIQIVKLQPGQLINFSAITSIGIEKETSLFSPVSICVYDELDIEKHIYKFILESRGQLEEQRILKVAYLNLVKKLNNIFKQIPDENNDIGSIEIYDEDHTVGNLLSHGLNKAGHKAAYKMPHPLEKRVVIDYELKSGQFKNVIKKVIEDFIVIYTKIDKLIEKNII
jgi:DNA-directed RNA polymerase subunit L